MLSGQSLRVSMQAGFSLVQVGEFAFIIAQLGERLGVTQSFLYPIVVAVSVVTTFLTPYIMKTAIPCYNVIDKRMSPGMKLTLEKRIAHGGHPVLRWMMDNIYIRTDPAGNIKADKERSTEKIDGAVATIMALDRAIRCGNVSTASVYDDRGILFI